MVAVPPFVVGKPVTGEHFIDRESEPASVPCSG